MDIPEMTENEIVEDEAGRVFGYFEGKVYVAVPANANLLREHLLEGKAAALNSTDGPQGEVTWVNPLKRKGAFKFKKPATASPASNGQLVRIEKKLDELKALLESAFESA